ncbi:MAG TPA: protein kinase, partial [Pirellulales bacterium]
MASPNPNLTFDDYVKNLRFSRLVEAETLTAALADFASCRPSTRGVEEFGRFLIDRNLITLWHHRRLAAGYAKGFFLGQYKLLRRLGAGGMGSVYLAEHREMRRLAALKVVSAEQVSHMAIERFRRESQIVAALDHPHIVRAHDFNRDGKYHFLVMEYLEGIDLDRYVKRRGPLSPRRAADLIGKA